jgi:hypothetical protein
MNRARNCAASICEKIFNGKHFIRADARRDDAEFKKKRNVEN